MRVDGLGKYSILSRTIDDAAGECFDKSAKLMGLPYPGGPHLAKLADTVSSSSLTLPKVMRGQRDFSFSGLKTAIAQLIKREALSREALSDARRAEVAHAVQAAIVATLTEKLVEALRESRLTQVVLSGGVAANRALRASLAAVSGIELFLPSMAHCTDNAAMIALVAGLRKQAGRSSWDARVYPRWPVEEVR